MNYAIVFRLLSYILFCEAALLLLPATASLCYGEWNVLGVFALTAALCLVLGLLLRRIKPSSKVFYMREVCEYYCAAANSGAENMIKAFANGKKPPTSSAILAS